MAYDPTRVIDFVELRFGSAGEMPSMISGRNSIPLSFWTPPRRVWSMRRVRRRQQGRSMVFMEHVNKACDVRRAEARLGTDHLPSHT